MKQTALKADPAKVAAFVQRGRASSLNRGSGLARGKALTRTAPTARRTRSRPRTPPDVWAEVLRRDKGRCVWLQHLGVRGEAEHPHHLLPKSMWPEYASVRENIVGLAAERHMQHEFSPCDRLPWDALPAECQVFLRAVAVHDPRAARLVETKYPADAGQSGHLVRRRTA